MNLEHEVGHYGTIQMRTVDSEETEGAEPIPIMILKKAPLKYYEPGRDRDDKADKSKADVVFAWRGSWRMVGWFDVEDSDEKIDAIIKAVRG